MLIETSDILRVLQYLFFPIFFQKELMQFAWGSGDPYWLMVTKRVFLILPCAGILLGLWTTILSAISIIARQKRQRFVEALFITWWDMGRSILNFWAGAVRCVYYLVGSLFGLIQFAAMGLWLALQDLLLIPLRLVKRVAGHFLAPGIPWIAVSLTLIWCGLEAAIFTYVMMPLVIDTLSNLTGQALTESMVQIPLFIFMLFLILGSYAVLSTLSETIQSKNVTAIGKILLIEIVAMFVEVIFLYREFVDSLVPWFAQHTARDFSLGIVPALLISSSVWLGIRGMTWFLFASHGTPTLLAVIRGMGVKGGAGATVSREPIFVYTEHFIQRMKEDGSFIHRMGEGFLAAFVLPPLQVIAAAVNFCTLLLSGYHLFELPFKTLSDLHDSKAILNGLTRKIPSAQGKAQGRIA